MAATKASDERKHFAKGVGVGTCAGCGRRYRPTQGQHASGSELCDDCWELAGLENEVADGYYTGEEGKEQALPHLRRAINLGGDPARLATYFPGLWTEAARPNS